MEADTSTFTPSHAPGYMPKYSPAYVPAYKTAPAPVANTPGMVTGGGVVGTYKETVKAIFGFTIHYSRGDYAPKGNLIYQDHRLDFRLNASSFDLLLIDGYCAWFTGIGTLDDGKKTRFTVEIKASPDTFFIYIPSLGGYESGGRLTGGNLNIHQ